MPSPIIYVRIMKIIFVVIVQCYLCVFSVLWKSLQEDNRLAPTAYR